MSAATNADAQIADWSQHLLNQVASNHPHSFKLRFLVSGVNHLLESRAVGPNCSLTHVACTLGLSQLRTLEANLVDAARLLGRYTAGSGISGNLFDPARATVAIGTAT
jgi:hypothetical protein